MFIHIIEHQFDSPLTSDQTLAQIKSRLADGMFDSESEFLGFADVNRFKIKKNPRYNIPAFVRVRNSWSPIVTGTVENNGSGSRINVAFRPAIPTCVLDFLFQLIGIIEAIAFAILGLMNGSWETAAAALFGVLFVLVIELMVFFFFKLPAFGLIDRLEEIFSGQEP